MYIRTYIHTYVAIAQRGGMTQIYPAEQQNEPQAATYIFNLHCRSSVYHKEKWCNSVKTYFVVAQFQQLISDKCPTWISGTSIYTYICTPCTALLK